MPAAEIEALVPPQPIVAPWTPLPSRRKRVLMEPLGATGDARPIRGERRGRASSRALQRRGAGLDELVSGRVPDTGQIAQREGCSERSVRMTLHLAFVAPEIMKAAVEGSLPHGVGTTSLADAP